jgi:predicted DNA-binding transcriptional regulator YafY
MNRIDRLVAMVMLLQSRRVVTAETIAEHFETSVRTVYRDISALGEAGVPIVAEAGMGYSLARGYHMPPIMFTEEEAAALMIAAEVTEQVADDSLKKSLGSALLKARSVLSADRRDYVTRLEKGLGVRLSRNSQPTPELMAIQDAVVRRRCLRVNYNAGRRGEITERILEPLAVLFYSQQWHIVAWCRLRQALRDFRLDRMEGCEILSEVFEGHLDFSLEDFISRECEAAERSPAIIDVAPDALDWFRSQAPSPAVREEKLSDGWLRIEILAYAPQYLAHWLMSFGTRVRVEYPPALREQIQSEARAVLAHYES